MVWRTALLITDFSPEYKCPNIQITTSTTIFSTNRNRIFVRVIDIKSIASSEKKWTIEENRHWTSVLAFKCREDNFSLGAYIYVSYTALRKYRLALLPVVAMVDKNRMSARMEGTVKDKKYYTLARETRAPTVLSSTPPRFQKFWIILNNSKLVFKNKFILETWMT